MNEFATDHDPVGDPGDMLGLDDPLEDRIDLFEGIRHAGTIADRAIIESSRPEEDDVQFAVIGWDAADDGAIEHAERRPGPHTWPRYRLMWNEAASWWAARC